ncbi:MAG: dipeptidase [Anaerolineales bacterium]
MCDTFVALPALAANGAALFAKNSDRHPNEAQALKYFPAMNYPAGARLQCTYIEIPQASHTHAVFLSKPFWMWGAEMGINEHGLVIGNEAVFSKIPANKTPALLGMDLLRAALERAATPYQAIEVIAALLEQFGQGGNGGYLKEFYYHNSFIIASQQEAWVMEAIDREWAAKKIEGSYAISNCLTLDDSYDFASQKFYRRANIAAEYSDFAVTTFGKGRKRRAATQGSMNALAGRLSPADMMSALRHHDAKNFDPQNSLLEVDVCMHAGFGPVRVDQSVSSFVAELTSTPLLFATATSAPCTGVFKPIWLDAAPQLTLGADPRGKYDPASIFWAHERLHRAAMLNYAERIQTYAAERDELERRFIEGAQRLNGAPMPERADFTAQCFEQAARAEVEWLRRVEQVPARKKLLYSRAWKKFNQQADMPAAK